MEILLVDLCDEWKSTRSLAGVITKDELVEKLSELIKNGVVEVKAKDIFENEDNNKINDEKLFDFLDNSSISDLNNGIDHLFIYEVTVGEIKTNGSTLY